MKKRMICLLSAVFLMSATFAAAQEDRPKTEDLYGKELIGFVSNWTLVEWLEDPQATFEEELIYVQSPYIDCWMPVPDEGARADQYFGKGARFVLEAPSDVSIGTQALTLYRPVSLEIVGEKLYGGVVDIGKDFIVLETYADDALSKPSQTIRIAIEGNTVAYRGDLPYGIAMGEEIASLFEMVNSCEVVYDTETGIALTLREANG